MSALTHKTTLGVYGGEKMRSMMSSLGVSNVDMKAMGSCFDSAGNRYDCVFDAKGDNFISDPNGAAAPTKEEMAMSTWGFRPGGDHFGHPLTHIGYSKDSKGATLDVWFCQKDKKFCVDRSPS